MSRLVSNVLDLMRFESGQVVRGPIGKRSTISSALHFMVSSSNSHSTTSVFGCPRICRRSWSMPSDRQVFANLFNNIGKYTPAGTHVAVTAAADGSLFVSWWMTMVRGCRREIPPVCSTSFSVAMKKQYCRGGTGARDLPSHHKGSRRRDRSSPAHSGRTIRVHAASKRVGNVTQAMHQILAVEDEPDIRKILRALLEGDSVSIHRGRYSRASEIEARSHKPDLLLVDLGLRRQRDRSDSAYPDVVACAYHRTVGAHDGGAEDCGVGCWRG